MSADEVEAPVEGDTVVELQDWASLWADLLHVDMALHARDQLPNEAANLFARRALWEGAVVAYGRTAKSGRRKQQISELITLLGPDAEEIHEAVIKWRDKHAAHRVDVAREKVDVRAILDRVQRRIKRVGVRVAPTLGPEEEGTDLAPRFKKLVEALRNATWEQRIAPLEARVMDAYSGDVDALLSKAKPVSAAPGFAIDISPSGEGPG
jgi:hypothetical protein